MRKTPDTTLAEAMRILSIEIQSDDGVANAAILESSERIRELSLENSKLRQKCLELEASNELGAATSAGIFDACICVCKDIQARQIFDANEQYMIGKGYGAAQCADEISYLRDRKDSQTTSA